MSTQRLINRSFAEMRPAHVSGISAEGLSAALNGRKSGTGWMAHCPAHDDREPSLAIAIGNNGRVLFHCHAGCDQQRVIAAFRSRGLWGDHDDRRLMQPAPHIRANSRQDRDDIKRTEVALAIWQAATPAEGTLVETYLSSRLLHVSPPPSIRFHRGLKHPSGATWPAMVALVTRGNDDTPAGIHRTFLTLDGSGKAPIDPQRMMLGPCHGGAVRLAEPSDLLMVGEGLETCLAAMQAAGRPAWAALSTSGLRTLDLPHTVCEVIILADGDDPGESAARVAALRWMREGRRVRIARPPRGMDFNELLRKPKEFSIGGPAKEEAHD